MSNHLSIDACQTLGGLFRARVAATPDVVAYRQFDFAARVWVTATWQEMATEVARWQAAMKKEGLQAGDRVGVMLRNCREWVVFDQAALGLGLITVPLYTDDRPENVAYIVRETALKLLVVEGKRQWQRLQQVKDELQGLERIISLENVDAEETPKDPRLDDLQDWLFGLQGQVEVFECDPTSMATIVFTSGTLGRPKGVMLSHHNILTNAEAAASCANVGDQDVFLSFLPLSHMLERTAGYYLPMLIGAQVAYARSIPQLAEDLVTIKPTILISVPRIYERVYGRIMDGLKQKSAIAKLLFKAAVSVGWLRFEYQQNRRPWDPRLLFWPVLEKLVAGKVLEKLGGRLQLAICGGAALSPDITKLFVGLGLPLLQGYGLTESSPVASVNRPENNLPHSIGLPLPDVEVKIGDKDELLIKGDLVMLGYWNNQQATATTIDADGWLHTGDQARMDDAGRLFITGRLKEIIVMGNGEKVPPADMEMALCLDGLFEQALIVGEGKPYLTALLVLNEEAWKDWAYQHDSDPTDPKSLQDNYVQKLILGRMADHLKAFPGYARVRRVTLILEPWTIDAGLLTPTLKMKRLRILEAYKAEIESMYAGHQLN